MRFVRLVVDHFQVIDHAEVELGPGLNVLSGPNDIGKSTLTAALRAALLLPHASAEGERSHTSWLGEQPPQVELSFVGDDGLHYRVTKRFGSGARGFARLERSRDGQSFDVWATARQVEERLRELLGWGIPAPGGRTSGLGKGLPHAFLSHTLLGEQTDVDGILQESLEQDPADGGRLRLTAALQAFAQDPRFKAVFDRVQAHIDQLFSPRGLIKRGKGTRFLAAQERVQVLQNQLDALAQRRKESDLAERRVLEHLAARTEQRARHAEATLALRAVESRRAASLAAETARQRLAEAMAELASLQAEKAAVLVQAEALAALHAQAAPLAEKLAQASQAARLCQQELERAREHHRQSTSAEAAAARRLERAELETALAQQRTLAGQVRTQLQSLDEALARHEELARLQAQARVCASQLEAARAREEAAALGEEEARASHQRLLDLKAYSQWEEARQAAARANQASFDAEDLLSRARVARGEQRALLTAAQVRALPDLELARRLVALEQDLRVAQAALGGGLTVTVRGRPGLALSATADGVAVKLAVPAGPDEAAELEASRQIALLVPDLLEVEILAGDAGRRRAAEALQRTWKKQARPVLQAAGVSTARELEEACNERESLLQKSAASGASADRLEAEAAARHEQAATKDELDEQVAALEARLEGRDLEVLARLKAGLRPGAAAELERTEKALEAQRTLAGQARAAARAEAEGLLGQQSVLSSQLAAASAARDAAVARCARPGDATAGAPEGRTPRAKKSKPAATGALDLAAARQAALDEATRLEAALAALQLRRDGTAAEESTAGQDSAAAVAAAEEAVQTALAGEEAARAALAEHRSQVDRAAGEQSARALAVARLPFAEAEAEVERRRHELSGLGQAGEPASEEDVTRARDTVERTRLELEAVERELDRADGALTQVGGAVLAEKHAELQAALLEAKDQLRQVETDAAAWRLLGEVLRQAENTGARHVGRVLADQVSRRFQDLTGQRYGLVDLDAQLRTLGVQAAGGARTVETLSAGTREQLATLLRLAIAESLQCAIVLDDHLVQSDPERLGWFVAALQAAARQVQVIVVTCRPDDYQRAGAGRAGSVHWVDLDQQIRRSGPRTAGVLATSAVARPAEAPATPAPEPVVAAPEPVVAAPEPVAPADDGRPFAELLGRALDEMGATSEDFARSVMAGHRVVQLWLRGGSLPAAQLRATVIEYLLRGSGNAADGSARARAAARLASL